MNPIPTNYTEFLYWLKDHTENYWSQDPKTSTNEDKCPHWAYEAKWIGMTNEQIDQVQHKYLITFTPEHREFLKIMHTIDRNEELEECCYPGASYWVLNEEYKDDTFEYLEKANLPNIPFWRSFYLFDWTNHANNVNL